MANTTDHKVDLHEELEDIADNSRAVALVRLSVHALSNSPLASTPNWLMQVTRHSICYRWLTKEPEPDIVVIDLHHSVTVRPIISSLDHLGGVVAWFWQTSNLKRMTDGVVTILRSAAGEESDRHTANRFEPPTPPDENREGCE